MNEDFSVVTREGVSFLVYLPWWTRGIIHGSTLRPVSYDVKSIPRVSPIVCSAIGVDLIATLKQTHGSTFFDTRSPGSLDNVIRDRGALVQYEEGDAMIVPLEQNVEDYAVAYGVCTADCVPVVIRAEREWAVIHAGWRGLANGIVKSVVQALGEPLEAAIFPCAGPERYEVGWEVVESIGPSGVYVQLPGNPSKALLDTEGTARRQLSAYLPVESIHVSGICTLSDTRFHSFRRDGERAGRSLTFVVPGV
jgi:copper oxidase (laccase) domain-containing protein